MFKCVPDDLQALQVLGPSHKSLAKRSLCVDVLLDQKPSCRAPARGDGFHSKLAAARIIFQ